MGPKIPIREERRDLIGSINMLSKTSLQSSLNSLLFSNLMFSNTNINISCCFLKISSIFMLCIPKALSLSLHSKVSFINSSSCCCCCSLSLSHMDRDYTTLVYVMIALVAITTSSIVLIRWCFSQRKENTAADEEAGVAAEAEAPPAIVHDRVVGIEAALAEAAAIRSRLARIEEAAIRIARMEAAAAAVEAD